MAPGARWVDSRHHLQVCGSSTGLQHSSSREEHSLALSSREELKSLLMKMKEESEDPASGSFPMSQFFTSGGQSIGVSASASVLPMHTARQVACHLENNSRGKRSPILQKRRGLTLLYQHAGTLRSESEMESGTIRVTSWRSTHPPTVNTQSQAPCVVALSRCEDSSIPSPADL